MTSNSVTGFPRRLREALSDGKTEYAAKLFSLEKNAKEILNNSWDIIPVLTENLNIQIQNVNNEVFNCSKHLLNVLSEQSQPQEALLQLVTELEEAKDDVNFVALLDPVFNIILRILEKRGNSLAWCFNSIQGYLEKCEPPDYKNLNDKERLFVENNHNAKRIIRLYDEVLVFYNKIAKNFNSFDSEAQSVVQKFLIQLLGKPLCYLSMEEFGDIKTQARGYAETIVEMISGTLSDPIVFLEYKQDKFNDELIVPGSLGLANLFYLLYGEGVQIDNIPKVYHPVYIFQVCLHLLYVLLDQQNQISSEKGLKLGEFLLLQVKDTKLSYLLLGSKDHSLFCKALTDVIVYHPSKQVRTRALDLFKCYLLAFEVRATYLIIFNLLDTLTHSGLMGYIITIYKDLLNKALLCSGKDDSLKYFKGPKLFRLLRKFCHLSENKETNLMENSDQIISALNLLRYLALRDSENLTEVWDFLPDVEDIFLQPLRKGIELSRAHYELKIKEFDDVKSAKTRGDDMEVSVRVNGEGLPQINKEDQLKVLNSSLTALDVMQSLLTRVTECVASKSL